MQGGAAGAALGQVGLGCVQLAKSHQVGAAGEDRVPGKPWWCAGTVAVLLAVKMDPPQSGCWAISPRLAVLRFLGWEGEAALGWGEHLHPRGLCHSHAADWSTLRAGRYLGAVTAHWLKRQNQTSQPRNLPYNLSFPKQPYTSQFCHLKNSLSS